MIGMNGGRHPNDVSPLEKWLISLYRGGDGFGLILFFWTFLGLFFASLVLLAAGWLTWNWWLFFTGLICLQLFFYIAHIGSEHLDKITPFDG